MPWQQPLPPKGDAGQTEPALAPSSRSQEPLRGQRGLGGIAGEEGVSLQTGAEPRVYKAWGSGPGGLFSTTTPRLTWQHGEAPPAAEPRSTRAWERSAHGPPPAADSGAASGR